MVSEELIRQVAEQVALRLASPSSKPEAEQQPVSEPVEFEAPWTGETWPSAPSLNVLAVPAQQRTPTSHPSEDQFEIDEAVETTAAVNELVEFFESKRCTIEGDKPCDHCGACRRLGF
jgi:hypothetical protein